MPESRALPGYVRAQARKLIDSLANEPRPSRATELRGKPNIYRIWLAAKWRIAYMVGQLRRLLASLPGSLASSRRAP